MGYSVCASWQQDICIISHLDEQWLYIAAPIRLHYKLPVFSSCIAEAAAAAARVVAEILAEPCSGGSRGQTVVRASLSCGMGFQPAFSSCVS